MDLARSERLAHLNNELLDRALQAAVGSSSSLSPELLGVLASKYFGSADVRYHALRSLERFCSGLAAGTSGRADPDSVRNMFDVLSAVPAELGEEPASWCEAESLGTLKPSSATGEGSRRRKRQKTGQEQGSQQEHERPVVVAKWANPKAQRRAFSDAWLAFLSLPLPDDIYKKVLSRVHSHVLSSLVNPVMLSDFLSRSLDRGGLVGILALHGIFVLVTKHGLEYPQFFTRLYNLLVADVFYSRHRAQFLK